MSFRWVGLAEERGLGGTFGVRLEGRRGLGLWVLFLCSGGKGVFGRDGWVEVGGRGGGMLQRGRGVVGVKGRGGRVEGRREGV